jgi:RimJ/RimL family protein N-acetyltransferase
MPGARVETGKRVTLRTVEGEDIPFLQRAGADPEIRYPLGNPLMNRDRYEVSTERGTDQFLVCLEPDDTTPGQPNDGDVKPIGQVNVEDADYKRPELGYWLVPAVHGQGYGTESVALDVELLFSLLYSSELCG